ncbi:MAG TPA: glycosyltransferase family 1 protein [Terracidiphilus sp.]|jgi:glycosyltransferase involved in cell wall biosynthesis
MQICYDYQIFAAQRYGGISRYFVEIATRLQRFPSTNVQVIAPLYRCKLLDEKRGQIPVLGTHFNGTFERSTGLCMAVGKIVTKAVAGFYRPDLVHETFYSRTRTVRTGRKTVISFYDAVAELFPLPPSNQQGPMPVRQAAFDRADHLICISQNTRTDLIRLYNVDPAKVSVIPLATSMVPSKQAPAAVAEPFFLFVGGRWGYKNFLGFAEAYYASKLYKSHKVICFGGDPFASHEVRRLNELGIPLDRFEIIDGDDELLARYYAAAVAFVYPSLYEGFGIPLLEAMECSCPVLCGNTSSMPEVAGDAALYFDPSDISSMGNALLKIASSPEERQRLIEKGKERVKLFSWDKCAQETYAVYERVLSNA